MKIRRYRVFDQEVLIPLSQFSVLTGPNNLGKSTVLRALELFFSRFRNDTFVRVISGRHYSIAEDYPKSYRRGRRWPTLIEIRVALSPADQESAKATTGLSLPADLSLKLEIAPVADVARATLSSPALSSDKDVRIFAGWFAAQLSYVYIPATRGIDSFKDSVFAEIVKSAIRTIGRSKSRVEQVEKFHADVATRIRSVETALTAELQTFLPSIKRVTLKLSSLDLLNLVSVEDVEIDDGALTSLRQKGDGFKSVFTMSVLQYIARQGAAENIVFAIEEPESHLHASAIHEVRSSLLTLSESFQTLITTHSPVLIQREPLEANVIVGRSRKGGSTSTATAARTLRELRESLGIKLQDNMTSAEVVILVEGATEESCLGGIIALSSTKVSAALSSGRLRIVGAGGASKMTAVLRALARDVVACVALCDADGEGSKAHSELVTSGLIGHPDVFSLIPRPGCVETEFEDLFAPALYIDEVATATGIAIDAAGFEQARRSSGGKVTVAKKWSLVMASICAKNGKRWDDVGAAAKAAFAAAIIAKTGGLNPTDYPWAHSIATRVEHHFTRA